MKLFEFPLVIKDVSLKLQNEIERRDEFLSHKKAADIAIDKIVQSLDKKVCANDRDREIKRFELRDDYYQSVLDAIADSESVIALLKIELQYLRDAFSVAKIENQGEIAAAYVYREV